MSSSQNSTKESTLQLRVSVKQKHMLSQAAKLRNMTLSSFVLEKAFTAAEELLFEQMHFSLEQSQWEVFCEAIDKPARSIPNLSKLLNEKGLLDE